MAEMMGTMDRMMKKSGKKWKRKWAKWMKEIKGMEKANGHGITGGARRVKAMEKGTVKKIRQVKQEMGADVRTGMRRKREMVRKAAGRMRRIGEAAGSGMEPRTDLALEEKEKFPGDGGEIRGVSLQEWYQKERQIKITEVKILNDQGAKAMGKDKGTYLTIEVKGIKKGGEELEQKLTDELALQIRKLASSRKRQGFQKPSDSQKHSSFQGAVDSGKTEGTGKLPEKVLVVGLGNLYVTPDSLGPRVLQHLQVTRHYDGQYGEGFLKKHGMASISGIAPGVMAQTGMETAEILKGVVNETKPELVIAIDALSARSVHRLGCTIQLSDTGIRPGSGVGNHRNGLVEETLGVPVLAVGVPTVVGAAAIVQDTMEAMVKALEMGKNTRGTGQYLSGLNPDEQYALIRELLEPEFGPMFVTPPDIEERVEQLGRVIAEAVELALL